MNETKKCSKCKKIKQTSEFYFDKQKKTYKNPCKECLKQNRKSKITKHDETKSKIKNIEDPLMENISNDKSYKNNLLDIHDEITEPILEHNALEETTGKPYFNQQDNISHNIKQFGDAVSQYKIKNFKSNNVQKYIFKTKRWIKTRVLTGWKNKYKKLKSNIILNYYSLVQC